MKQPSTSGPTGERGFQILPTLVLTGSSGCANMRPLHQHLRKQPDTSSTSEPMPNTAAARIKPNAVILMKAGTELEEEVCALLCRPTTPGKYTRRAGSSMKNRVKQYDIKDPWATAISSSCSAFTKATPSGHPMSLEPAAGGTRNRRGQEWKEYRFRKQGAKARNLGMPQYPEQSTYCNTHRGVHNHVPDMQTGLNS